MRTACWRVVRYAALAAGLLVAVAVVAALVVVRVSVGTAGLPPRTAFDVLAHYDPANPDQVIVVEIRLPRTVLGLLTGTEPDLILRTIDIDDALYGQLTGIAPTVVISFQKLSLTEVASRVGEVLGRTAEADALLAKYNSACQAIQGRHAAVLEGSGVLLIPAGPGGVTEAPDNAALTGNALWRGLPAARAGCIYPVVYGAASLGTALEWAPVSTPCLASSPSPDRRNLWDCCVFAAIP